MEGAEVMVQAQAFVAIAALALLWALESWVPCVAERPRRLRHAAPNLALAGINLLLTGLVFAAATAAVAAWAGTARFGLLHWIALPSWLTLAAAILLFDAWMYLWHRANHAVPFLWRFHRAHHSDPEVDVTTALRFHPGEIALSSLLRLAVVPILGLELGHLLLYEMILLPVIALHHSNIALPEVWDRRLRLLIVTPGMHHLHHSDWRPETDSNFSSVFSFWDRLCRTFRRPRDRRALRQGLPELVGPPWQGVAGLLRTPLAPLPEPPQYPWVTHGSAADRRRTRTEG